MKPIPKAGIGFKSSLVLGGKAAKDNFTTEPRSPSRLLNRIKPICNQGKEFDEALLQASGQTITRFSGVVRQHQQIRLIHQELASVYLTDYAGVTNVKIVTTNHGRQLRGPTSIDNSLQNGVSAQTAVITLSGWSGEIRGEIAVKLVLVALPLRPRLGFELFGGFPKSSK
ncbi:hypothetical protein ACFQHW_11640 [Lapidilactobacillus achengensis]|uniref:Uncharacterized protein n=1 Tax=Lapidilactobacillus achengensis TaxID=2486000 RepID=A0ABW1URA7_9LACO|nr:hypothetical protein [Lapidilactobacillus achengensis]